MGNISYKGSSFGVASVLFVGLFFGALGEGLSIPDVVFQIGLVLFIYAIGLSSAPAFFQSIRKNGFRDILFITVSLTISSILALFLFFIFGFNPSEVTGIYAGGTTNTPALAGAIDLINQQNLKGSELLIKDMVVGYSFSYPMGIIGVMIAILICKRMLKVDFEKEKKQLSKKYQLDENLTSKSIIVTNPDVVNSSLRDLNIEHSWNVVFGRTQDQDKNVELATWNHNIKMNDLLMVVGSIEDIHEVAKTLGEIDENSQLNYARSKFDVRRIFVSNPKIAGKSLAQLEIDRKYQAIITRIRRGDMEMLAKGHTVLQMGDRIRFVARRKDLRKLSALFGDSYTASSQVNLFSFGVGIACGVLLGLIPFTLPGGITFKLGLAGGPLIISLILGTLKRTGPIDWTLPYGANLTLQQIGLTFLLAAIGVSSGSAFADNMSLNGLYMILGAGFLTIASTIITLIIGYKLVKIPFSLLLGFVSNQVAILDFNLNLSKNKVPNLGFTMMMPIALILKIVYAQLLFIFLQ